MNHTKIAIAFYSFALGIITSCCTQAIAGDCTRCGAHSKCHLTCKVVREDKKITTTCWGVKEEDFCIGGPSCEKCEQCEEACSCKPDDKGVSTGSKKWTWKLWEPNNYAYLFTKKKLMKKTETKTIPSFKWVVENLCDECKAKDKEKASEK